jgi:hypothetical protein
MDNGANKLGRAIEKRLEVERGVERVGHLHEVIEVGDFDTRVDGVDMRVRICWIGRTVIAFELVGLVRWRKRRRWGIGGHTFR